MRYKRRTIMQRIIVVVFLFIAISGIGVSNHGKTFKNRFNPRTFVEIQVNDTARGINEIGQFVEFSPALFLYMSVVSRIFSHHVEICNNPSDVKLLIFARPPPLAV
jgi:hypothetical protein